MLYLVHLILSREWSALIPAIFGFHESSLLGSLSSAIESRDFGFVLAKE